MVSLKSTANEFIHKHKIVYHEQSWEAWPRPHLIDKPNVGLIIILHPNIQGFQSPSTSDLVMTFRSMTHRRFDLPQLELQEFHAQVQCCQEFAKGVACKSRVITWIY